MSEERTAINSAAEMQALGKQIGSRLLQGDVVLLRGGLGAGKTTLARGIGSALGIEDVTSPTFVISKIYMGSLPFVHVDAYRLIGSELALFDDLDLEARIPHSITVIEWGEGFVERLVDSFIEIDLEFGASSQQRLVTITGLDR